MEHHYIIAGRFCSTRGTCVLLLEVSGADSQQADIGFVLYRVTDCAHGKIVGSHTDNAQILSR
jgi:hypothetical protein